MTVIPVVVVVALAALMFTLISVSYRASRKRDKLLCVAMRQAWRDQQGPEAAHFRDWLPLTDALVAEWFHKHKLSVPSDWLALLAEADAEANRDAAKT
jgi:hypothetical protein